MRRLKVLVVAPGIPVPDLNAASRRLVEICRALARDHDVFFCCPGDEAFDPRLPAAEMARYRATLAETGARLVGFGENRMAEASSALLYDVILFEYWWEAAHSAPHFLRFQPQAIPIIDTVDVHFAREEAALSLGLIGAEEVARHKREELATYRNARALIGITPEDRVLLDAEEGLPPVSLVPIVYPVRERAIRSRAPELLFVGGFVHPPNGDGICWFAREIWPLVRERIPEATVTVIGSRPTPEIQALGELPGVQVLGFVADLEPHIDRAAVSIAPLRYGGGMKGKVIEAMTAGMPVVSTTFGAQGTGAIPGEEILVADEPVEFAAAVCALLADPARQAAMGLAGQRRVDCLCGTDAARTALNELLAAVTEGKPEPAPPPGWTAHRWRVRAEGMARRALRSRLGQPLRAALRAGLRRPQGTRG